MKIDTSNNEAKKRLRLEEASATYVSVTGDGLSVEQLDPSEPGVASLYREFCRIPFQLSIGANHLEWLAVEMGLKPALREVIPLHNLVQFEAAAKEKGMCSLISSDEVSCDPCSGIVGRTADCQDALVFAYVGSSKDRISRLACIDRESLNRGLAREEMRSLNSEMGELLGYAPCCVSSFESNTQDRSNKETVAKTLKRSKNCSYLLNNLLLSAAHYLPWNPCRFDCESSIDYARKLEKELELRDHPTKEKITRMLTMPRLYFDDRRQVILEGEHISDGRFTIVDAYSPFVFDRSVENALFDWAFYVDVISKFHNATELRAVRGGVELTKADAAVAFFSDALWIPFQENV